YNRSVFFYQLVKFRFGQAFVYFVKSWIVSFKTVGTACFQSVFSQVFFEIIKTPEKNIDQQQQNKSIKKNYGYRNVNTRRSVF
ncbi:MAG: hypothetical protein ACP5VS_08115, partial [Desulfomonilaceae bacterium]